MQSNSFLNFKKLSIFIIVLIILAVIQVYFFRKTNDGDILPVEVIDQTVNWQTLIDGDNAVSYKYPSSLSTVYIKSVDWPPVLAIYNSPLQCVKGERTEEKIINKTKYCVTKESEGAAGTTYTSYAYAVQKDNKVLIYTFTLRLPNCGNYSGFEADDCEAERNSFDIDRLIDNIVRTTRFLN